MNGTAQHDALVTDYLQRLEHAAWTLTPERRAELVLEIRDHIADARTSAGNSADEAWTRTLLDRLGTPEEIVASAVEGEPPPWTTGPPTWVPPMQTVSKPAGTGLELAAVLLLTAGSVIPFLGWIVGVILLWASKRWHTWEKVIGTLIVPSGPIGVIYIAGLLPAQVCSTREAGSASGNDPTNLLPGTTTCTGFALHPAVGIPVFVFAIIAPLIVAGWLYSRARARADLEPPQQILVAPPRVGSPWGGLEIAAVVMLAVGSFVLPGIGGLIGLVLAWSSTAWTTAEKLIATAIAVLGPILPLVLFFALVRN